MYKVLLALLLLIIFTGCKKEKPQVDPQTNAITTIATSTVSGLSPSLVSTGMVVTLTGTNFGTSASDVTVLFANNKATIQSVTPTQITAIVPILQLASGNVSVIIGNQTLTGLFYTTLAATVPAPAMNTIVLTTQSQVDSFVVQNAGKEIQITGNLTIGRVPSNKNPDIHDISGLSKLTTVTGALTVLNCPLLTDVSALNNITTAGSVGFYAIGATSISMDKLTTTKSVSIGGILVINN